MSVLVDHNLVHFFKSLKFWAVLLSFFFFLWGFIFLLTHISIIIKFFIELWRRWLFSTFITYFRGFFFFFLNNYIIYLCVNLRFFLIKLDFFLKLTDLGTGSITCIIGELISIVILIEVVHINRLFTDSYEVTYFLFDWS